MALELHSHVFLCVRRVSIKYSFNFSHKSVTVICLLFSAQYLTICVKASAQATSSGPAVCILVERRKATGMLFVVVVVVVFALKLMFHWLWYNASAHSFCPFVLWPSSEHACASFS